MSEDKKSETNATDEMAELFHKHTRALNMSVVGKGYKPSYWYLFKEWFEKTNPFGGYMYVADADEYINAPYRMRTIWLFWYRDPLIVGGNVILGRQSERDKMKTFIEYKFPIQHLIRCTGYALKFKLSKAYDWTRYQFNPRQKWLTKQIPKSWADKTWLISELNFAMVADFVEGELCFDHTDYDASGEGHSKFSKELKQCYDYIKVGRPQLQKDHLASYPDLEDDSPNYDENNRLELLINSEDTRWLVWIVTNRDYLWT